MLFGVIASQITAPPPYHASAVHFDGSTILGRGPLIGIADQATYIISEWLRGITRSNAILNSYPDNSFNFAASSQIPFMTMRSATDNNNCDIILDPWDGPTWHHCLISCDWSQSNPDDVFQVAIDGVLIPEGGMSPPYFTTPGPGGPQLVNLASETNWYVGDDGYGDIVICDMAQLYLSVGQPRYDLSVPGNIAKFVVSGKPVNVRTSGAPAAIIILDGDASTFPANLGTGGAFSVTAGALTNASTSPSD